MFTIFLCAIFFSLIFYFREKSTGFSILYLSSLPLIIFSGEQPVLLFLSFLLGYLLFSLFSKPSLSIFAFFILALVLSLIIIKPRMGIDLGMLNAINAQRGEHPGYQNSLFPKLIHNKTELSQSFVGNFDKILSPVAIFASGFWHKISPYYPLGYLFPWDIYFIYRIFRQKKSSLTTKSVLFFVLSLVSLLLLVGFVYLDQAILFGFAIIYFLALLAAQGYSTTSKKTRLVFIIMNTFYLMYHLVATSYFKI